MSRVNIHVGSPTEMPRPQSEYRYGIFIRPPFEVSVPALEMMRTARDLFGFHAAAAYPPHVTLLGSIALNCAEEEFIAVVGHALRDQAAFRMHGRGLNARVGQGLGIDLTCTRTGERNLELTALFDSLRRSTSDLRRFESHDRKAQERRDAEANGHFDAHLTIVGHDGSLTVRDEARALLEQLVQDVPVDWLAETVTLYRFWSEAWHANYWQTQEWVPVASWRLETEV